MTKRKTDRSVNGKQKAQMYISVMEKYKPTLEVVMKSMYWNLSEGQLCDILDVSYIFTHESAKAMHSADHGCHNYIMYLASWDKSGHQVCAYGQHCHEHCLVTSGLSKVSSWTDNAVMRSRIRKTKALFEQNEAFVVLMVKELISGIIEAKEQGMDFAVRINGSSDLSPMKFVIGGLTLMDVFPDVQFYDYTKDFKRCKNLWGKYKNYDLTFSFDGYNTNECLEYLKMGGRVAVVFEDSRYMELDEWWGYPLVCGDKYDMRFQDPAGCVIGLTYHETAKDYVMGEDGHRHYVGVPDTAFVVKLI